ncbi:hypothetical protein [Halorussus marinus]|uniref:hypothetical protein n=1 Tax=Halorussus marinus TaxID=2505976 RepID=UPI00106EBBAF|nr:hypothetical protein [Halorussus marinus]
MGDPDGDAPKPLDRVRRAKARPSADRWLDGGAVAAGMVAALGPQVVPSILFAASVPETVLTATAGLTALCVPLGGVVAGRLGGPGRERGARHGAVALVASTLAAAGTAVLLVGPSVLSIPFAGLALADWLAPGVAAAGLAGGAVGALGAGRRRPDD